MDCITDMTSCKSYVHDKTSHFGCHSNSKNYETNQNMLTKKTKSKYVDGFAAICSMKLYSKKQRSVTGHIKTINRTGDDRCVPEENKSCY